jgi:hypothetical protein
MTDPSAPIRRPANGASGQQAAHGGSASGTRGQTLQGRPPSRGKTFAALSMWSGDYPEGGVAEVLSRMAELAREGAAQPAVQQVALKATEHLPPDSSGHANRRDRRAVARAVYEFVLGAVAYRHDDHGVEQLQTPLASVRIGAGDCDDMAVLAAALLKSLGVPTRFRAIATDAAAPHAFTHVYCQYQDGLGKWRSCDPVGNPGPDAIIAEGRVENELTHALSGGKQGPQEIAVLSASDLSGAREAEAAAAPPAGTGTAALAGTPTGPISGPDAWLQIVARSHSGRVPDGERFTMDCYIQRSYPLFQACAIRLTAYHADTGEELARSEFTGSKFTAGSFTGACGGETRLSFPQAFAPAETPVVLKVHDTDYFSDPELRGQSNALPLTEADVEDYDSAYDDVREVAQQTSDLIESAITVGGIAAAGFGLTAAWPYVERVFPDFTEEDR